MKKLLIVFMLIAGFASSSYAMGHFHRSPHHHGHHHHHHNHGGAHEDQRQVH